MVEDMLVIVEKSEEESYEVFTERCWIIINNYSNYIDNIDKLIALSKVWANMRYLNATYKTEIMDEVKKLKLYK